MDFASDLHQQLANGEVCAFAGAGLSMGAGLPGWYDLISQLSQRIGYDLPPAKWATSDTLIDAAQAYVNSQGLHSLITTLRRSLDSTGKAPTAAHRALADLPISLVFTANYDNLLERAYRDAGKRVNLITKDSLIPFIERGAGVVNVIKLWGDLDQPESIVLTREQFERFFLERPQLVKLLETQFGLSTMLYLGWSHRDPHFNLIFGEILARYGGTMKPGYAVMFDVTAAQRDEFKRKQIRLVELPADGDRTAALAAWLGSLAPGPGTAVPPSPSPVPVSPGLTAGERQRLEQEYSGLQAQYDTLSARIQARDKQITRTLDLVQKQIYEEERAEWAAERETVAGKMSEIERRLAS